MKNTLIETIARELCAQDRASDIQGSDWPRFAGNARIILHRIKLAGYAVVPAPTVDPNLESDKPKGHVEFFIAAMVTLVLALIFT